ncbi:MAG: nitroreductase [Clostridiales bacterium]|nr:MAG: nitroreductase [Clostridiales bacterium]
MEQTIHAILSRRSIRKYKPIQISEEELEILLEAGMYAPSGGNCQYTHFTVVQKPETLRTLKVIVEQVFSKMEITENMYKSKAHTIQMAQRGNYDFIYSAPTLVIVTNKRGHGNAMADSAAAIENILLAATSMNIGSCWINQLTWISDNEVLREALRGFGVPDDEIVCGSIALGYSDQLTAKAQPRKEGRIRFVR